MGRSKAWLPFGDELMLPRVVRLLSEVAGSVVVVAAVGQELPPLPDGVRVLRDELEGHGPLAGLAVGLDAVKGESDVAYLSSCDVPFLKPAFIRQVVTRLHDPTHGTSPAQIAVPRTDGYFHPLAAAYSVAVLPEVRALLEARQLRPVFLFERVPTVTLTEADFAEVDPGLESLRNLNRPEEYELALRQLSAGSGS